MPSTTWTPVSGVMTWRVQPSPASPPVVSSARTTVVPTAITRCAAWTASAVAAGTLEALRVRGLAALERRDTPQCRTTGATCTPRAFSASSTRRLNGRPALGISALPGSSAKIVWKSASGRGCGRWR